MIDFYLFRNALKDLLRTRRLLASAGLVLFPAAVAVVLRIAAHGAFDPASAYNSLEALVVYGFLLVILAVVFGTGVISQEIEQKTIGYLLTRPLPRWRILLAKFAAVIVTVTVTLWLATIALALATYVRSDPGGAALLRSGLIKSPRKLVERLRDGVDPLSLYLRDALSPDSRQMLDDYDPSRRPRRRLVNSLVDDLNRVIKTDRDLGDPSRFAMVTLENETRELMARHPAGSDLARLNRWLLEEAWPDVIPGSRTGAMRLGRDLAILPVGALAYGALFLALATLVNRSLIVGLVFAFGWESWVPLMPGSFRLVSIMTYLRVLAPHPRPEAATLDITQFLSLLPASAISTPTAWWVVTLTSCITLALALLLFSVREYVPRDDLS
jgi:hypothetical protein